MDNKILIKLDMLRERHVSSEMDLIIKISLNVMDEISPKFRMS